MKEDQLISIASQCGWVFHNGTLNKGSCRINIFSNGKLQIIMWHEDYEEVDLPKINSRYDMPWQIGPFKNGYFSLKACRWVY